MTNDRYIYSVTNKVISEIVAEQDEYTTEIILDYVNKARAKGEFVSANIIPEGKLRHILNLGLSIYSKQYDIDLIEDDMFSEVAYVEYLQKENDRLKEVIKNYEK